MVNSADPSAWRAAAVLPGLRLKVPLEAGKAAFAPASNERVRALVAAQPKLGAFLAHFTDAFGVRVKPTVLIVRTTTKQRFLSDGALPSLRDVVAVSSVAYGRATQIAHARGTSLGYADGFAFYPWMLDRQGEGVAAMTSALWGFNEVERFRGQSPPGVPVAELGEYDLDAPLLAALLERWRGRFSAAKAAWSDQALFRSLNMAHQACLMPAPAADSTLYDVGRQIALWVSAFEILTHPGPEGRVKRDAVMEKLDQFDWRYRDLNAERYPTKSGGKVVRRGLPAALYLRLHNARNDFLHGNPVSPAVLRLPGKQTTLFQVAAPLYRLALTAFLDLRAKPLDGTLPPAEFGAAIAERSHFESYQGCHENAVLTAWFGRERKERMIRRRSQGRGPRKAVSSGVSGASE